MTEHREGSTPTAQTGAVAQGQNEFRDDIIMMVDDEPLMISVLEVYLQEQGFEHFIAVNDSTQAMDTILRERPDCVFLDLNMPEVDGFEILEKIRSTPEIQHLAAIVLTSDTDPETKLKALELGATDFLEKPIDSSELILRLRNTLRAKAYQDQLTYYDGLTRLPNRTFFLERLGASIQHAKQRRNDLALVMLSIDRFQAVNDSLGPMAGDEVLKAIAGRLRKIINDAGAGAHKSQDYGDRILARMGGDEFAIALPGRMSKSEVVELTDEIRNALRKPFDYQGKQVFLTTSMGMARYPHDAGETGQLLKSAGAARELAKKNGGNSLEQYSKDITAKADARRSLEAELHDALEKE
ncbi:MAG: diguanylate cyclase, partial [Halieaceae bacterium]|nr:diguanylate cyclase [Halieaceae bacterium]